MSKINVLKSSVYNKIAAGEVVERPASVVKELVENSIDAGADKIYIYIESGGISKITVNDNGGGIPSSDVEKAFLPHATSKINKVDDLFSIETLGFRGEALASIASISKVELQTKTLKESVATKLNLEGGKVKKTEKVAREVGTTIIVSDLFFNTPARLKFLKKPRYEAMNVTTLVSNFILANPDISFEYYIDKKLILKSNGLGIDDAIKTVYGLSYFEQLLSVEGIYEDIAITGYIGKPDFTRGNRTNQIIIINNRLVVDKTVQAALYQGFSKYLMKGRFPVCVLNIQIPIDKIDVNVHPQKSEVRFQEKDKVFRAIYYLVLDSCKKQEQQFFQNAIIDKKDSKSDSKEIEYIPSENPEKENLTQKLFNNEIRNLILRKKENVNQLRFDTKFDELNKSEEKIVKSTYDEKIISQQDKNYIKNEKEVVDFKIVGRLFDLYILLEYGEYLLIIDSHAAHEKVLYDQLKKDVEKNKLSQQLLLIPYILELTPKEAITIHENLNNIKKIGIDIDAISDTAFKVSAVPASLSYISLDTFFGDILKDKDILFRKNLTDYILEKLMQKACKAAVRANEKLSEYEIEYLLDLFIKNKPTHCPHGRPTILFYKKDEIEKDFKRIV